MTSKIPYLITSAILIVGLFILLYLDKITFENLILGSTTIAATVFGFYRTAELKQANKILKAYRGLHRKINENTSSNISDKR